MKKPGNTDVGRRRFLGGAAVVAGAGALAGGGYFAVKQRRKAAILASDKPAPLRDVAGKVAFITGGSSGIGLGQARVFHEAGMKVVIGYIRDDQLEPALAHFTSDPSRVHAIKVNVTDRDAMKAAADEIEGRFGGIHLVSNNAGIAMISPLSEVDYAPFDQCVAVNFTGVFNGVHEFLPRLRKHGQGGHIVTTSSMAGLLAIGGGGVYAATKFAVVGMMEALRTELEGANAGIGVSVFCPGPVNTNAFEVTKNLNAAFNNASIPKDVAAGEAFIKALNPQAMDPLEAARIALNGIRNNDLFILSHPEFAPALHERHEALEASMPVKGSGGWDKPLPSMYSREREKMLNRRG
jgi:NAD(P)-dependent dehydrogenase (short-subunit alcohol dehydrogenase family)